MSHPINLITTEEVAKMLKVSKTTVTRLCQQGLPHFKVTSKNYMFDPQAVLAYLSHSNPTPTPDIDIYDYSNVLIAPLTSQDTLNWYHGTNPIAPNKRLYILNDNAQTHIKHIYYLAPILNGTIKTIDLIVGIEKHWLPDLGPYSSREGYVVILENGFLLDQPITVTSRSGPGYTLNCLDLLLHNQGQTLSSITALRNARRATYPIDLPIV